MTSNKKHMKQREIKAVRYAFFSMLLTTIFILLLYWFFNKGKIGRDDSMIIELIIIFASITYNIFKIKTYIKKYEEVKMLFNLISIASIIGSIYTYCSNIVLFNYVSGITFTSVIITISLWIQYIRKEI